MGALTLPLVSAWRPEALDVAAKNLEQAGLAVEAQTRAGCSAVASVASVGSGWWATAAAERAADELVTGLRLADALEQARGVLSTGAADLGHARSRLFEQIESAQAQGFGVGADGSVMPPRVPPVLTSPENAAAALAQRDAEQQRLNRRARDLAEDIGSRLDVVAQADVRCAEGLGAIEFPQTLWSRIDAYLQRVLVSGDLLASLGSVGAGGVALALTVKNAFRTFGKGSALVRFWSSATAPITDYRTFLRGLGVADDALREFAVGKPNGGLLRFVVGSRAATTLRKLFLPATVVTGLLDTVTGGGYDGARGWATRGFGLAGAGGAATLLAANAGLLALGPVGIGIAAVAVLGYGLWSAGNLIYDHWDDITAFASGATDWAGDRLSDAGAALSDATEWAGDRLSDLGGGLLDAGGSLVGAIGGFLD